MRPQASLSPDDTPQQVIERVAALVAAGGDPDAGGPLLVSKLRLAGAYDDRQDGFFMLRTRLSGGRLSAAQAETVAAVAEEYAVRPDGAAGPERFVEITTRQGLQLHWIRLSDLPAIWERYAHVGLSSLSACGDTLRNVTSCPVAGLADDELLDARPAVDAIAALAQTEPELTAFLPRKFKVAVTGCRSDCVLAGLHDLALVPARRDGVLGFNVLAGGGLSDYPRLASPLDVFVRPSQAAAVVRAALLLYRDLGDFEHKAVNRFRRLVHELGPEEVARELRSRLPFAPPGAGEDLRDGRNEDHVGVRPERTAHTLSVGLCVPLGRLAAGELAELARLARDFGGGELRLTQRQNVILASVREEQLADLLAEPLLRRFRPDPDPFERAVLACTSAPFCKFAMLDAKARGAELIAHLRRAVPADAWARLAGLRIHLSGCKASCAQPQAAHVGLRGAIARDETSLRPAFDVAVGGDPAAGRLAAWTAAELPAGEAFAEVTRLVRALADSPLDTADVLREETG